MFKFEKLRKDKGLSMAQVARDLGLKYTTYVSYEKGDREPNSEMLIQIADYYGCTVDYLVGNTAEKVIDIEKYGVQPIEVKKFPLLGDIACGEPRFANEERESYVSAGTAINADFCLKARGDSMINARIMDGDIVFIRSQSQVENGEIAVVIINDEATL